MKEEGREFELVEADAAQKEARDRLAFQAWGQRLTPQQFLAREERLRGHPFAREAMRTWLLCGADGRILSSCESFQTPCRAGGHWGEAYEIASVFTEESLRGRGHAVRMLSCWWRGSASSPGTPLAVTLYSDVGPASTDAPASPRCPPRTTGGCLRSPRIRRGRSTGSSEKRRSPPSSRR